MEHDLLQVDRLIRLLAAVEVEVEFDKDDLHQEIISLATEYLTVGPDVELYRRKVREAGYPIYPGEVDRFGWLTAYFQFPWGILLFG